MSCRGAPPPRLCGHAISADEGIVYHEPKIFLFATIFER